MKLNTLDALLHHEPKQIDRAKKIFEELGAEDICTVHEATAPAA